MKSLIVLIGLLLLTNCDKDVSQQDSTTTTEEETTQATRISKKDIESLSYADYGLSNASRKAVSSWASYGELEVLIQSINNADLLYFEGDEEVMTALIQDLKTTIPDNVSNESIIARITALETKFYKLKSAERLKTTTKDELLSSVMEFLEASSNLNLQVNKKFEKEAQDISKNQL
ncbi:MAG: hypothetical protein EX254_02120 [Flavobacteriaceae bacterium]|nr:MAG: hypothetical protein EX254_02120 [Flavobacteriaceae bacterium]